MLDSIFYYLRPLLRRCHTQGHFVSSVFAHAAERVAVHYAAR